MNLKKIIFFNIYLFINIFFIFLKFSNSYGFEVKKLELLKDRDYYPEVLQLIKGAHVSIRVCMFQAVFYTAHSDSPSNMLVQGLVEASKRGVKVEVVLDNGGSLDEVASSNTQTARLLRKAGIAVFFDSKQVTTHTKFLILDTSISVLGSTNWTYHALAKNHELSAVVYSTEVAQRMNDYFEMIRNAGKRF